MKMRSLSQRKLSSKALCLLPIAFGVLCALSTGCDSSDGSPSTQQASSVPSGATSYKLAGISDNAHSDLSPELMRLTVSADHITGSMLIDHLGGYGVIDGNVDAVAHQMNMTVTFAGGRVLTCTIGLYPFGGWAIDSMSISDGSQVFDYAPFSLAPETRSAADYGVTDAGSSAIVLINNSPVFIVASIRLRGCVDGLDRQLGAVGQGGNIVSAVPPGPYWIEVEYLATAGNWRCDGTLYNFGDVAVEAGGAAVYSVEGGSPCGVRYERPDLVKQ